MFKILGYVVVIGGIYLFINWEEHRDDVFNALNSVDQAAQSTTQLRDQAGDVFNNAKNALGEKLTDDDSNANQ